MISAIFLTSGNLIADRRYEWARDLEAKGDLKGAADLLTQVLELAPGFGSAWFALCDDRLEAEELLARCTGETQRRGLGLRGSWIAHPAGHGAKLADS